MRTGLAHVTFEVEYRVAVSAAVFDSLTTLIGRTPGVEVTRARYAVVHFPADVRVRVPAEASTDEECGGTCGEINTHASRPADASPPTLPPTSPSSVVQRKVTHLRHRVGMVKDAPVNGVVSTEEPVVLEQARRYYARVAEGVVRAANVDSTRNAHEAAAHTAGTAGPAGTAGTADSTSRRDIQQKLAVIDPRLSEGWLQRAWPHLAFVAVGKGACKTFVALPGFVEGEHCAFGDVQVPATSAVAKLAVAPAPVDIRPNHTSDANTADSDTMNDVPTLIRMCRRTSFQWDAGFRVDCTTTVEKGKQGEVHSVEVECCGQNPIPFPLQMEDLLRRVVKSCADI